MIEDTAGMQDLDDDNDHGTNHEDQDDQHDGDDGDYEDDHDGQDDDHDDHDGDGDRDDDAGGDDDGEIVTPISALQSVQEVRFLFLQTTARWSHD